MCVYVSIVYLVVLSLLMISCTLVLASSSSSFEGHKLVCDVRKDDRSIDRCDPSMHPCNLIGRGTWGAHTRKVSHIAVAARFSHWNTNTCITQHTLESKSNRQSYVSTSSKADHTSAQRAYKLIL